MRPRPGRCGSHRARIPRFPSGAARDRPARVRRPATASARRHGCRVYRAALAWDAGGSSGPAGRPTPGTRPPRTPVWPAWSSSCADRTQPGRRHANGLPQASPAVTHGAWSRRARFFSMYVVLGTTTALKQALKRSQNSTTSLPGRGERSCRRTTDVLETHLQSHGNRPLVRTHGSPVPREGFRRSRPTPGFLRHQVSATGLSGPPGRVACGRVRQRKRRSATTVEGPCSDRTAGRGWPYAVRPGTGRPLRPTGCASSAGGVARFLAHRRGRQHGFSVRLRECGAARPGPPAWQAEVPLYPDALHSRGRPQYCASRNFLRLS
jgi:hypothetical protein